MTFASWRCV